MRCGSKCYRFLSWSFSKMNNFFCNMIFQRFYFVSKGV
nr:MAG TPA: hypothetical protein [Caudoviricetes sp.]